MIREGENIKDVVKSTIILTAFLYLLTAPSSIAEPPYLILTQYGTAARTQNILPNIQYLESLPFDGMEINVPQSWFLMDSGYVVQWDNLYNNWLEPLDGIFTKFTRNYLVVFVSRPADFFGDWTQVIENWRLMARGAKAVGMIGLIFDNEEYRDPLWLYPDNVDYTDKTLAEYRQQAYLRGKQIMQAVCEEFPDVRLRVLHGPYVSEPRTPSHITMLQVGRNPNDLSGPFFAGMFEGRGPQATLIDGGELYQYRIAQDFELSYQWRKYQLASDSLNCPFIPPAIRSAWREDLEISYGLYNRQWKDGYLMSSSIMRTTAENALKRCDEEAWLFIESSETWLSPGGMPEDWQEAIREAKIASVRQTTHVTFRPHTNTHQRTLGCAYAGSGNMLRLFTFNGRMVVWSNAATNSKQYSSHGVLIIQNITNGAISRTIQTATHKH